jgi:uncharacterized membrane protein
MNANLARIGTILYALVIGYFGIMHMMNATMLAGAVPGFVPDSMRTVAVYISGAAMILAALAFIINKFAKAAGILLAVLLLLFALVIHLNHYIGGDQMSMGQFLKDTGLAAAALIIAGISKN